MQYLNIVLMFVYHPTQEFHEPINIAEPAAI